MLTPAAPKPQLQPIELMPVQTMGATMTAMLKIR